MRQSKNGCVCIYIICIYIYEYDTVHMYVVIVCTTESHQATTDFSNYVHQTLQASVSGQSVSSLSAVHALMSREKHE